MKEPRSNRGMEEFKSKEDLEAEKKVAQERALQKLQEAAAAKKKKEEAQAWAAGTPLEEVKPEP